MYLLCYSIDMDNLERVKTIQKVRGLNDTQVAHLLGYKNRVSWAKIKAGMVRAHEVFQMRAIRAFPELRSTPTEKAQDGKRRGVKGLLDKIVLRVKKFV